MTAYAGAFVIKDALVKFGSTDNTNQCARAQLVPDTPVQTRRTLVPDGQVTDTDSPSWMLELSGLQDWESGGLGDYFHTNAGALISVTLAPKKGSGKKQAVVSVRILDMPFGGNQGEWAEFEIQLPVQGQPVFSAQA